MLQLKMTVSLQNVWNEEDFILLYLCFSFFKKSHRSVDNCKHISYFAPAVN